MSVGMLFPMKAIFYIGTIIVLLFLACKSSDQPTPKPYAAITQVPDTALTRMKIVR